MVGAERCQPGPVGWVYSAEGGWEFPARSDLAAVPGPVGDRARVMWISWKTNRGNIIHADRVMISVKLGTLKFNSTLPGIAIVYIS